MTPLSVAFKIISVNIIIYKPNFDGVDLYKITSQGNVIFWSESVY